MRALTTPCPEKQRVGGRPRSASHAGPRGTAHDPLIPGDRWHGTARSRSRTQSREPTGPGVSCPPRPDLVGPRVVAVVVHPGVAPADDREVAQAAVSLMRRRTRRSRLSRMRATSERGRPAGSGTDHSKYRTPGNTGQSSPHPMVTTTSAARTRSFVSGFGTAVDRSMPMRSMARTTVGWTARDGLLPADHAWTRPPARAFASAAAIWERAAFSTQTNSSSGTTLTSRPSAWAMARSRSSAFVASGPSRSRTQRCRSRSASSLTGPHAAERHRDDPGHGSRDRHECPSSVAGVENPGGAGGPQQSDQSGLEQGPVEDGGQEQRG